MPFESMKNIAKMTIYNCAVGYAKMIICNCAVGIAKITNCNCAVGPSISLRQKNEFQT